MPIDLNHANVLITGAQGFLGRHLVHAIKQRFPRAILYAPTRTALDLTKSKKTNKFVSNMVESYASSSYVFHLAGYNGGIAFNEKFPGDIFLQNTITGLNVLRACQMSGVNKVLSVVASCAYPSEFQDDYGGCYTREICDEHEFLYGPPHDSVSCHGYAKRNIQLASSFLRKQYGLRAVCACPTTLYGPGDSMNPLRTKVMGALIKKFSDGSRDNKQEIECWGTGKPLREFLYVGDAAHQLIETMLHYEDSDMPLNLGSGQEYSIKEVADKVASAVQFNGKIHWDHSKPDGQYRKRLDLTRMNQCLPPFAFTPLEVGIQKTVDWYRGKPS